MLTDLDSNGYYNKTIHKCVLKLHLPLPLINETYKNLYNKNEVSGVFYVDNDDNVMYVDKNEGDTGIKGIKIVMYPDFKVKIRECFASRISATT
jgi:hypothetical protein